MFPGGCFDKAETQLFHNVVFSADKACRFLFPCPFIELTAHVGENITQTHGAGAETQHKAHVQCI